MSLGIVIAAEKFSRKVNLTESERARNLEQIKNAEFEFLREYRQATRALVKEATGTILGAPVTGADGETELKVTDEMLILDMRAIRDAVRRARADQESPKIKSDLTGLVQAFTEKIEAVETEKNKLVNRLSRGDELPTGVLRDGQGLRRNQASDLGG